MSLDGLRAWIGEVERKLGMRTRVFLVLVAIAVGGAGAGIYLAIKAANDSVSKSEVQAVREGLEAPLGGGAPADVAGLEAELSTLRAEVEELKGEDETSGAGKGGVSGKGGSGGSSGKSSEGASNPHPSPGTGSAQVGKLQELVEKAKEHAE